MTRVLAWPMAALALMMIGMSCSQQPQSVPTVQQADAIPGAEDSGAGSVLSEPYRVQFVTTKGTFVIDVHPEWAPKGAARFRELVEQGFYNECSFFRSVGFVVQWGIHGDPEVHAKWFDRRIDDDPVKESNSRGTISFATSGANSRTTQVFINRKDNAQLDGMGFSPFGEVVEGMDVVDLLYRGYDEAPSKLQNVIRQQGNEFLRQRFPMLDYVTEATIVDPNAAADATGPSLIDEEFEKPKPGFQPTEQP